MERVEILLEKFMQKVPQGTEDNRLAYDPVGVINASDDEPPTAFLCIDSQQCSKTAARG